MSTSPQQKVPTYLESIRQIGHDVKQGEICMCAYQSVCVLCRLYVCVRVSVLRVCGSQTECHSSVINFCCLHSAGAAWCCFGENRASISTDPCSLGSLQLITHIFNKLSSTATLLCITPMHRGWHIAVNSTVHIFWWNTDGKEKTHSALCVTQDHSDYVSTEST